MPAIGTVKPFDTEKGQGLISDSSGKDIYVHYSAINSDGLRSLDAGQEVEYEVEQGGPHGVQATNVTPR
ncbi:cold shock domain-containing protein [Streptomyces sp. NPDC048424]|uniref:cold shock domain-containing protein n=1 Tax=Streptomyces sp. NPDC048424 TaxID=3155265 RepID=UPI003413DF1A